MARAEICGWERRGAEEPRLAPGHRAAPGVERHRHDAARKIAQQRRRDRVLDVDAERQREDGDHQHAADPDTADGDPDDEPHGGDAEHGER